MKPPMPVTGLASSLRREGALEPKALTVRPPRTCSVHCLLSIMVQRTVGVCAVLNSHAVLTAFHSQVAIGVSNRTLRFA